MDWVANNESQGQAIGKEETQHCKPNRSLEDAQVQMREHNTANEASMA